MQPTLITQQHLGHFNCYSLWTFSETWCLCLHSNVIAADTLLFNNMAPSCSHLLAQGFLLLAESHPPPTRCRVRQVLGVFPQLCQCALNKNGLLQEIQEEWSTGGWSQSGDQSTWKNDLNQYMLGWHSQTRKFTPPCMTYMRSWQYYVHTCLLLFPFWHTFVTLLPKICCHISHPARYAG